MSWNDEDEITVTYGTITRASKEAFDFGNSVGHIDELDHVLDLLSEQMCSHSGCAKCEAYDFISTRIAARQETLKSALKKAENAQ